MTSVNWRLSMALLACFVLTPLHAAAGTNPPVIEIPFTFNASAQIESEFSIDGQAGVRGLIDTAATFPMIDDRVLGPRCGDENEGAERKSILGLMQTREYPVIELQLVSVGSASWPLIEAACNGSSPLPGTSFVFPAAYLERDIIDFDFPGGRILAYDGRPRGNTEDRAERTKLIRRSGLWFIEVKMRGEPVLALIDTAAIDSILNSRAAKAGFAQIDEAFTRQLQGSTGNSNPGQSASIAKFKRLQIGDTNIENAYVIVSDLPLFKDLNLADQPAMILGLDLLRLFRVQIDLQRDYVYFHPPDSDQQIDILLGKSATRLHER